MTKVSGIELGMAGELRVASELLLRGHRPSLSLVDTGVDIVTDKGLRIQVKTARANEKGIYHFNVRRSEMLPMWPTNAFASLYVTPPRRLRLAGRWEWKLKAAEAGGK